MTLMMTVSGVRGIVGHTMTPSLAAEMGAAFGSHVADGSVVVGRDTRPSGPALQAAVISGLLATGRDVIDLGVVTTPGVALMVGERQAGGGVVITASHNPSIWNGIKFITAEGAAPPSGQAERILDRYRSRAFTYVAAGLVGQATPDESTHERHVNKVLDVVDAAAIRRKGTKVVLDSINGAGCVGGRRLLEQLGCEVVHVNGEPTGQFAHTPEPTAENLGGLCDAVREHGAAVGFAQDPDADRLAIVDNRGRYIGEEYTVVLAALSVLTARPGPVAVNLSTSRMIDDVAAQVAPGVVVHRTPVGEANVAQAVINRGCVIGGEGNGGVIDPRIVTVRDSFVAMALVLDLLAARGRPLSAIVDEMPAYTMLKKKYELDRSATAAWLDRLRSIVGPGRVDDSDGLRIDWPEGWVHVRPSNTEPIARIIAEAQDSATAESLVQRAVDLL